MLLRNECREIKRIQARKIQDLQQDPKDRWRGFQFFSIEITSLGIVTSHFEDIKVLFKGTNINFQRMISTKCMEVVMRASFYIYIRSMNI